MYNCYVILTLFLTVFQVSLKLELLFERSKTGSFDPASSSSKLNEANRTVSQYGSKELAVEVNWR